MSFARASRFQSRDAGRRESPGGRKNVPVKARGRAPIKPFNAALCTCPWKKPYTHDQIEFAVKKARRLGQTIYSYLCACDRYHVTSKPQQETE